MLFCGQEEFGKNCFLNQFFREKVTKEGDKFYSLKLKNYIHNKYPIRIFEATGFENEISIKYVLRTLDLFDNM